MGPLEESVALGSDLVLGVLGCEMGTCPFPGRTLWPFCCWNHPRGGVELRLRREERGPGQSCSVSLTIACLGRAQEEELGLLEAGVPCPLP